MNIGVGTSDSCALFLQVEENTSRLRTERQKQLQNLTEQLNAESQEFSEETTRLGLDTFQLSPSGGAPVTRGGLESGLHPRPVSMLSGTSASPISGGGPNASGVSPGAQGNGGRWRDSRADLQPS